MDKDKVCEKAAEDIINEFRLPRTVCHPFIKLMMTAVYVAGVEEGRVCFAKSGSKSVIQLTLMDQPIKLWDSVSLAAKSLNISKAGISKAARGKELYYTAGGYKWKYAPVFKAL